MHSIESISQERIDPTNEPQYRDWSARYNHALREAAPQPVIRAKCPKPDANMMVKNWVDLRCACQRKVSS